MKSQFTGLSLIRCYTVSMLAVIASFTPTTSVARADTIRLTLVSEGQYAKTSFEKTFAQILAKELAEYEILGVDLSVRAQRFEAFDSKFLAAPTWDLSLVPVTSDAIRKHESFASPIIFGAPYVYGDYQTLMQSQKEATGRVALASLSTNELVGLGYVNAGSKHVIGSVEGWGLEAKGGPLTYSDLETQATVKNAEKELAKDIWELADASVDRTPESLLDDVQAGKQDLAGFSLNDAFPAVAPDIWRDQSLWVVKDPVGFEVSAFIAKRNWWNEQPYAVRIAITNALRAASEIVDQSLLAEEVAAKKILATVSSGKPIEIPDEAVQEIAATWIGEVPGSTKQFVMEAVAEALKKKAIAGDKICCGGDAPDASATVDYFTNRESGKSSRLDVAFTDKFANQVTCGSVSAIGLSKGGGAVQRLTDNCAKLFVRQLCGDGNRKLLLIHGFNTSFREAVEAVAALKDHLAFKGIVLWSWPSRGEGVLDYPHDKEDAGFSGHPLAQFLALVPEDCASRLTIVAHSMGNVIALDALQSISVQPYRQRVGRIVFAAPDVHASNFESLVRAVDEAGANRLQLVLYACAWDVALAISAKVNGEDRAGQVGRNGILILPNLESIAIDGHQFLGVPTALNHGYIYSDTRMHADISKLMSKQPFPAKDRGLTEKSTSSGNKYFTLP